MSPASFCLYFIVGAVVASALMVILSVLAYKATSWLLGKR